MQSDVRRVNINGKETVTKFTRGNMTSNDHNVNPASSRFSINQSQLGDGVSTPELSEEQKKEIEERERLKLEEKEQKRLRKRIVFVSTDTVTFFIKNL